MATKNTQVMSAIEQDIRARGLRPGEPYQSAREVAQMLNVSPMTADRAMRRLALSGVLSRRHGSGTYVGEGATELVQEELRYVQIVVAANVYHAYRVVVENIAATAHREFPQDAIEQIFVPESKPLAFCGQLIRRWEGRPPRAVVLVSCSQPIQRLFGDTGVPVVATGGVARSHCPLPWIDMDYREAGRLLSAYARSHGHRRILVLMNHLWGSGDNDFLDGVDQGLQGGAEARVRSVEWDAATIETVLHQALRGDSPPQGVFCTTRFTAEVAVNVAERLGLTIPERFVVGTVLIRTPVGRAPRYAYTRWSTTHESNDALRRMMHQMDQGRLPDPAQFLIPVELVEPDESASWM